MPNIQPGSKVLVTGATGFIAPWIILTLLKRGFRVRGTVRSATKGKESEAMFSEFGDKFEFIVVEDMQKDGAFDEAVKGVDAVEHVASPTSTTADDPQELIGPAVQGTTGILSSIAKHGSGVKRVVVTSSVAVLTPELNAPNLRVKFTEKDWNEASPRAVEELGREASGADKYCTSKILAEKAAWEFVDRNKADLNWDLVTLIPPWVFGPIMHKVADPSSLGFSCNFFYKIITDDVSLSGLDLSQPLANGHYVDVRDLAQAHVDALVKEEAGGQRLIVSAGTWTGQDFLDALATSPLASSLPKLPKGTPGAGKQAQYPVDYDSSKVKKVLGMKFRSLEETTRDSAKIFHERGWFDL